MNYELRSIDFSNAKFTANQDGTVTCSGLVCVSGIAGAPAGKFLQRDYVSDIVITSSTPASQEAGYIQAQVVAFVANLYPNS